MNNAYTGSNTTITAALPPSQAAEAGVDAEEHAEDAPPSDAPAVFPMATVRKVMLMDQEVCDGMGGVTSIALRLR